MKVDIVIKTYPPDYPWLAYALKSIQKFATGFRDVIVMHPRAHTLPLTKEKLVPVDYEENYLTQQVAKLYCDNHTDADFILHFDSDCVLQKPVTPETFMRDGRALWYWRPWEHCCEDEKKAWMHVMVKCLRAFPPGEFMRKSTMMIPRFAYAAFREFMQKTHGWPLDAYIANQPAHEFSEYNCIGAYLHQYHHDRISWHNEIEDGVPEPNERQFWSWGGLTPEIRKELELITA